MGRLVYAEENLLNYLNTLTKENSSDVSVGLIIGQSTKARDYVVHMASTKKGIDTGHVEKLTFNSVRDINDALISYHSSLVNFKLPGGFSVLGIFICSPTDIFGDTSLKPALKKLLFCLKKGRVTTSFHLSHPSEKLLFHYNPVNQKYICYSLDVSFTLKEFNPVDWKFQRNCTKWCQISSKFSLNLPPIVGKSIELKMELDKFNEEVHNTLNEAIIVVGNKVLNKEQSLETIINARGKKKMINGTEIQHLDASIFTPLSEGNKKNVFVEKCDSKIGIKGIIRSQAFISQKGTMEEAILAVKQDISRSLASRLYMHLDSLVEEPEEKNDQNDTIHEPPRRVSFSLPNSPLCFNDYVFSGEDRNDCIQLGKFLLDVELTDKDIDWEYEVHADPSDLYDSIPTKLSPANSDDLMMSTLPTGFLIAAISFAVILIAIAVTLRMQRTVAPEGESS